MSQLTGSVVDDVHQAYPQYQLYVIASALAVIADVLFVH